MGIFHAYDIRGVVPLELNKDNAYRIARAFLVFLNNPKEVIVGYDCRLSSPELKQAVFKAISDSGAVAYDIGLTSSPMFYFALVHTKKPAGLMITASHNPPQYNGLKMCRENGIALSKDTGIDAIEKEFNLKKEYPKLPGGDVKSIDVLTPYTKHMLSFVSPKRKLKVVLDASNGMAGHTLSKILDGLMVDAVPLYFDPDGRFPNHSPNPILDENIKDLIEKVKKEKADFGVCFDADADRARFVDDKGNPVPAEIVLILLAKSLLKTNKNAKFIADLRVSKIVRDVLKDKVLMSRVGHSFIKKTMREQDILLGGELSGHFYFGDDYYFDDGVLAFLKLLGVLSRSSKRLSELRKTYDKYEYSGEINLPCANTAQALEKIKKEFSDAKLEFLDGVSITYKDWWGNVRPSNTEPVIRIVVESKSKAVMKKAVEKIRKVVR